MIMNQMHTEYTLNIVTDKELSQQIQMMFWNMWLLMILKQVIVPLCRIHQ